MNDEPSKQRVPHVSNWPALTRTVGVVVESDSLPKTRDRSGRLRQGHSARHQTQPQLSISE